MNDNQSNYIDYEVEKAPHTKAGLSPEKYTEKIKEAAKKAKI